MRCDVGTDAGLVKCVHICIAAIKHTVQFQNIAVSISAAELVASSLGQLVARKWSIVNEAYIEAENENVLLSRCRTIGNSHIVDDCSASLSRDNGCIVGAKLHVRSLRVRTATMVSESKDTDEELSGAYFVLNTLIEHVPIVQRNTKGPSNAHIVQSINQDCKGLA